MGFDSGGGGGGGIDLADDEEGTFGADDDFVIDFDSAASELLIRNSSGTVIFRLDADGQLELAEDLQLKSNGNIQGGSGGDGIVGFTAGGSDNAFLADRDGSRQIAVDRGGPVDFKGNILNGLSTNDTDDSMTADPETASESGFFEIDVGGTTRQVPFYDA